MASADNFLMVCCHQGAEGALKAEMLGQGWTLAYSRPGFVTFKSDPGRAGERPSASPVSPQSAAPQSVASHAATLGVSASQADVPRAVFARTASWSLGRVVGTQTPEVAREIVRLLRERGAAAPFAALHLWSRDRLPAGERGYEPGLEPLEEAIAEDIHQRLRSEGIVAADAANVVLQPGEVALDVVLTDPGQWMVGWHRGEHFLPSRWPGGFPPLGVHHEIVSRAYFKAAEALLWSRLPIRPGDIAVEIGSAPGGAAQRLLELGLQVIGVDPADMEPQVAEHPSFTHLKARGGDLKRSQYSGARWLLVDSNVRPDKTLVTVANIVCNRRVSIEGMLLTMKIGRYDQADRIPGWCRTIRQWGFDQIEARQLATGRCEVCIAARRSSVS